MHVAFYARQSMQAHDFNAPHPVYPKLDEDTILRMSEREFMDFEQRRREAILQMDRDPIRYGYELPIWSVKDALLDINLFPKGHARHADQHEWNRCMRKALGFDPDRKLNAVLENGCNRGAKTEFGAKRLTHLANNHEEILQWAFHAQEEMSVRQHQKLFWKYMPTALKTDKGIRTNVAYITYRGKTGFGENSFILPNGSEVVFKFYTADPERVLEGPNVKNVWCDELVPLDWVKTLMFRVATNDGFVLVTFTPKNGYNNVCAWFYEGAEIVREATAFLLPRDNGEPDLVRALGFHSEEEYRHAKKHGPFSRPEDVNLWIEGKSGQPAVPPGRVFETVPRVMRCAPVKVNGQWIYNRAVLFTHGPDNPFGNPENVMVQAMQQGNDAIKWRVYGYATKMISNLLTKFGPQHIIKASAIPKGGTNYLICDPASDRNWFFTWAKIIGNQVIVYREWPGNYQIPGVGFPGEWAEADDKRPDGKRGPAQASFGFGLKRYKSEMARLEGWTDYSEKGDPSAWSPESGAREQVYERIMDCRPASTPRADNDRPTTLLTKMEEIGLTFYPSPADTHDDLDNAISILNSWLDWEPGDPSMTDKQLLICEDCVNTIWSMRVYTGADGLKGACKDPIDNLRMLALLNPEEIKPESTAAVAGMYY